MTAQEFATLCDSKCHRLLLGKKIRKLGNERINFAAKSIKDCSLPTGRQVGKK